MEETAVDDDDQTGNGTLCWSIDPLVGSKVVNRAAIGTVARRPKGVEELRTKRTVVVGVLVITLDGVASPAEAHRTGLAKIFH